MYCASTGSAYICRPPFTAIEPTAVYHVMLDAMVADIRATSQLLNLGAVL
jgi:hypothetical protein